MPLFEKKSLAEKTGDKMTDMKDSVKESAINTKDKISEVK